MNYLPYRIFKDAMRPSVSALGYRVPHISNGGMGTWSLKDMLCFHSDISVVGNNYFKASFSSTHYYEALRYDWYHGFMRIQKQRCCAEYINRSSDVPAAWVVVSCYYTAFFAAVELLRAMGIWFMFFSGDHIQNVAAQAAVSVPASLIPGGYTGTASWDSNNDTITVTYRRSNGAAHQTIWRQIAHNLLNGLMPKTSSDKAEMERLGRILGAGKGAWHNPSDTRNEWNYQQAKLYLKQGEQAGKAMRKLLANTKSSYKWVQAKKLFCSEETEAAALVYVMELLCDVLDHTKNVIFDSTTLKRLA